MDKEKAEKIKKVLEEGQFNTIKHHQRKGKPILISFADILILINHLESENERLNKEKEKVLAYVKTDNYAKLKKEDMYWGYQMAIGMLEAKIDQQKDRIAELENQMCRNEDLHTATEKLNDIIILKNFTERVKDKFNDTEYRAKTKRKNISVEELKAQMDWILHEVVVKNIDETLKEFLDGKVL